MSLNYQELSLFTKEFKELLPLKIEKLYIPENNILVLTLYKKDFKKYLLIEIGSNDSAVYFVKERPAQNIVANIQNRFRDLLSGGLLRDIKQVNNDRIIEFTIDVKGKTYQLLLELTGRHGNLFILNNMIIEGALLLNKKDNKRDLSLYSEYEYPAVRGGTVRGGTVRGGTVRGGTATTPYSREDLSFLDYLENEYAQKIIEKKEKEIENSFLSKINRKIKKLKNKKNNLLKDLEKLNSYKNYKKFGELLKANLYKIKRGMSSILVTDYYSEKMEEIEVKLDKPKTPIENMEYYFKKYEKFKRGVLFIEKELKKIEIEIEKLSTQPVILIGEQVPLSLNNNRKKNDVHTQYKTYLGSNGFKILVGKGSVDNDYLTFKVASGNDIWLHVLSYSGSHVVIKKNNKKDIIDINTIYEAAHLAVLNSKAPNNDSVEVCYTYRKFVKKPPKSNPGAVIYTQEKRVYIKLDKNITDNLKSV